jgi:hypothetical protein
MDETSWKAVQLSGKTIAPTGAESVSVLVDGNEKDAMSAICTVSSAGDKLPSIYILRGETEHVFHDLEGAVPFSRITYSHNGWMDETVMLKHLSWLHACVKGRECVLVLDSFPAHGTPAVLYKAWTLQIWLLPVPRGLTGEFQPLDRKCFGPLKRISQKLWDRLAAQNPKLHWNHKLLEEAWASLRAEVIEHAFKYEDRYLDPQGRYLEGEEEDPNLSDEHGDEDLPHAPDLLDVIDMPFTLSDARRHDDSLSDYSEDSEDQTNETDAAHVDDSEPFKIGPTRLQEWVDKRLQASVPPKPYGHLDGQLRSLFMASPPSTRTGNSTHHGCLSLCRE